MAPEQGVAIKDFVNAGGGFYARHNCSHIALSPAAKDYRDVMGGVYISHPPLRPFQVRPTANKHPITDGIEPFMVNDVRTLECLLEVTSEGRPLRIGQRVRVKIKQGASVIQ